MSSYKFNEGFLKAWQIYIINWEPEGRYNAGKLCSTENQKGINAINIIVPFWLSTADIQNRNFAWTNQIIHPLPLIIISFNYTIKNLKFRLQYWLLFFKFFITTPKSCEGFKPWGRGGGGGGGGGISFSHKCAWLLHGILVQQFFYWSLHNVKQCL